MKKALLLMEQNEGTKAFLREFEKLSELIQQEFKFIEKRAEDLRAKGNNEHQAIWKRLEDYLRKEKILPENYDAENDSLSIENNVFFVTYGKKKEDSTKKAAPGFLSFLKSLIEE